MIHQLFTFEHWIISNFLTSSLLTFSVIYTFDFYIASEELKIYQNNLIKKYLTFFYLRNLFMTNTWAILFFRGFSFLLLLLEGSKLVSQATWRNEHNPIILTQAKIQSLTEKFSLERKKPAQWFWAGSLLVKLSTSKEAACFNCKRTYRVPSLHFKKSWIRTRQYLTRHTWKW